LKKIRLGIIFGGRSVEHEVSIVSARSILNAVDQAKYEVVPLGVTREGQWLSPIEAWPALQREAKLKQLMAPGSEERHLILSTKLAEAVEQVDIVFPIIHGTYGEDGTLQGLLEMANIPYVGAGVLGSAVGMDKAIMKALFRQQSLPVADYLVTTRREWRTDPEKAVSNVEKSLSYPCFVKPANGGSSLGISKARNREELWAAIELAAQYDRKVLVEQGLDAREIECSVLGNDEPIASVPGEIVPANDFYDYQAKYQSDQTQLLVPAAVPEDTAAQVQNLAVRAFRAIDCAGLARVDFFLTRNTGEVYLNEINTLPGFTQVSMYPKLWEATGIGYSELIDRLVALALERHLDKNKNKVG